MQTVADPKMSFVTTSPTSRRWLDSRKEWPELLALPARSVDDSIPSVDRTNPPRLPGLLGLPLLGHLQTRIDVLLCQRGLAIPFRFAHRREHRGRSDEHDVETLGTRHGVRRGRGGELVHEVAEVRGVGLDGDVLFGWRKSGVISA
jgi:hypothetical protein